MGAVVGAVTRHHQPPLLEPDDDLDRPAPEWCNDCGCSRFIDGFEWEVDVSRDGPDGPEWELAVLDCGHAVATGRRRGQHYP